MQAEQVLHEVLGVCAPTMHRTRRESLSKNVLAALTRRCLTVTNIGRALRSNAKEKHCIKRADRLLSNPHLHAQRRSMYARVSQALLGCATRPIILVDWSDLDNHRRHFLLRFSLSLHGRSMTLYEEVHGIDSKDTPDAQCRALGRLHAMLPASCKPIVVADAGFRVPWCKQVEALGWDWIRRIRNRNDIRLNASAQWRDCAHWHVHASQTPKALGEAIITRKHQWPCQLVLYKGKAKGRRQLNVFGQRANSTQTKRARKGATEPWLLATSLALCSTLAKRVVSLYSQRMQIEEAFRDLKSERFGLGLDKHRCRNIERMAILLLIAMLALFVAWLMGKALELTGKHRDYQANSVKHRAVLSTIFLGLRVIDSQRTTLTPSDIDDAIRFLQRHIQDNHCWA